MRHSSAQSVGRTKSLMMMLALAIALFSSSFVSGFGSKYDIAGCYQVTRPNESGTFVLTKSGNLEEVDILPSPTRLDYGTYSIIVSRKGSDLYFIDGTSIALRTRYCHEYSFGQSATLVINSSYGYTRGTISFE